MGKKLMDQFSYLHFCVGVIVYFWGIKLYQWIILHILFEIVENTQFGMNIINKYIFFWPGNKPYADSFINSVGDNIFGILGWCSAYLLDYMGYKFKWYNPHLIQ